MKTPKVTSGNICSIFNSITFCWTCHIPALFDFVPCVCLHWKQTDLLSTFKRLFVFPLVPAIVDSTVTLLYMFWKMYWHYGDSLNRWAQGYLHLLCLWFLVSVVSSLGFLILLVYLHFVLRHSNKRKDLSTTCVFRKLWHWYWVKKSLSCCFLLELCSARVCHKLRMNSNNIQTAFHICCRRTVFDNITFPGVDDSTITKHYTYVIQQLALECRWWLTTRNKMPNKLQRDIRDRTQHIEAVLSLLRHDIDIPEW